MIVRHGNQWKAPAGTKGGRGALQNPGPSGIPPARQPIPSGSLGRGSAGKMSKPANLARRGPDTRFPGGHLNAINCRRSVADRAPSAAAARVPLVSYRRR